MTIPNIPRPVLLRAIFVICFLCVIAGTVLHQTMLADIQKQINDTARTPRVAALENRVAELNASVGELANNPVFDAARHETDIKTLESQQETIRQEMTERIAALELSVKEGLAQPDLATIKKRIKVLETRVSELSSILLESVPNKHAKDENEPPFKVIDIEMRGSAHFVVIDDDTEDEPRILYPGDVAHGWRLDEIDEQAVIFRHGEITRRITLP